MKSLFWPLYLNSCRIQFFFCRKFIEILCNNSIGLSLTIFCHIFSVFFFSNSACWESLQTNAAFPNRLKRALEKCHISMVTPDWVLFPCSKLPVFYVSMCFVSAEKVEPMKCALWSNVNLSHSHWDLGVRWFDLLKEFFFIFFGVIKTD